MRFVDAFHIHKISITGNSVGSTESDEYFAAAMADEAA